MMKGYISHINTSPFYALHELTDKTTDVWIVCHGFGQLAERFVKKFDFLDDSNLVIAPQGLSRFYFDDYKKVGASWMTRDEKDSDLANQEAYFKAVLNFVLKGKSIGQYKVHFLGFSQGAATACRMISSLEIKIDELIVWAGGFPEELTPRDFEHINSQARLHVVYGYDDEYLSDKRKVDQAIVHAEQVLGLKANVVRFDGGHVLKPDILRQIIS